MAILKDKKVIIIGDRDGIPGPAIAACAESAGILSTAGGTDPALRSALLRRNGIALRSALLHRDGIALRSGVIQVFEHHL